MCLGGFGAAACTPGGPSVTGSGPTGRPTPDAVSRAVRSPHPATDELIRLSGSPDQQPGSLPRTRPAVRGTRYALDVGCSATGPGLRRTWFVTAGVGSGGLDDSDVVAPIDCDGVVRTVPFVARADGEMTVAWTDAVSSGHPSLTAFVVVVRPAAGAAPTATGDPSATSAARSAVPALATPPIAATQAVRSTAQTGVTLGTVTRGHRYAVAAACTSATRGRVATWVIAQPGFTTSDGGDDSVASGSFACTGAIRTTVHTLVVSGTVFLGVDVGRTAPERFWVTVSPLDGP